MTVKELIETLQTFDPALPIVYSCCSEWTTLAACDLSTIQLHPSRADGWVHDYWKQTDPENVQRIPYLAFPGN